MSIVWIGIDIPAIKALNLLGKLDWENRKLIHTPQFHLDFSAKGKHCNDILANTCPHLVCLVKIALGRIKLIRCLGQPHQRETTCQLFPEYLGRDDLFITRKSLLSQFDSLLIVVEVVP